MLFVLINALKLLVIIYELLKLNIHASGAFGIDFTHDCGKRLDIVRKGLLQFGVTGFCPTIVTTTSWNYHQVLC